ncbi:MULTISPECIES: hypothetical protein [Nostocaceae]|uniref:hypothetical protein n=1 Tax=Nostocaceae TaxID=1162 RepID=UPI001F557061|nr:MULTISPECIES: hypothetical protein [Nostocaceae]
MLLSQLRVQQEGFYVTTAEALLTMLIQRQLMLGQSAILDTPANTVTHCTYKKHSAITAPTAVMRYSSSN